MWSDIILFLRRAGDFSQTETEIHSNGFKAILTQGKVYKNGELLDLTAGEYKLLCLFMNNPGTVLSKEQILENLWDNEGNYIDNNTLNVYIRRLRTKIDRRGGLFLTGQGGGQYRKTRQYLLNGCRIFQTERADNRILVCVLSALRLCVWLFDNSYL